MPGRLSAVDTHPKRDEITKAILAGESHASISRRFGVNRRSVRNYFETHLTHAAVAAKHQIKDTQSIIDIANYSLRHLQELVDAERERMADPDDPTKLTMDPFAHEIEVVYTDTVDDPTRPGKQAKIKRRASLQSLIDLIRDHNAIAYDFNLSIKRADDREIHLKANTAMQETSTNLVKIVALLSEAKADITKSDVFSFFMPAIKRALAPFPGAFDAVLDEFEREAKGAVV